MVRIASVLFFFLAALPCLPAHGAQLIRPDTGTGLLIIRPFSPETAAENNPLIIYKDPGTNRMAELKAMEIPLLFRSDKASPGEYAIVVTGKKRDWLRIAYDDAGREGWIKMKRCWEYIPWNSFLKGRHASLLPKLRVSNYMLRKESSDISGPLANLPPRQEFRIIEVDGDWAKVHCGPSGVGWIRWRGDDGRFMISIVEINQ